MSFLWKDVGGARYSGDGFTRDISSRGLFVLTESTPSLEAPVQIDIAFPPLERGSSLHVRADAEVVRLELDSNGAGRRGFAAATESQSRIEEIPHKEIQGFTNVQPELKVLKCLLLFGQKEMTKSKFRKMCQWLSVVAVMSGLLPVRGSANAIPDKAAMISAPTSASTGSQKAAAPAKQSPTPANLPQGPNKGTRDTPAVAPDDYVIGPLDVLAINVWHEPELSRTVPVRPDGKISLPLVGEMIASGLTPKILQTRIAAGLELYMKRPEVTVIVQEANSHRFNIIGEVQHPGSFTLTNNMTVLDGLAASGGFRDFAKVKKIYLLRRLPDGTRKRIPFNYGKAIKGGNQYLDIQLQPGDTIVVP